ncbi:MAG: nuclear transport factor 2 family protein [Hyphomicrobiaceae bacterium]|nr:nuclear transport factor 2 family protein [Hyphomicrobiaceae bacterium]
MSAVATRALIRRYFSAFNAGHAEGMLDCLTGDVVHDVNQGARRHGKADFTEFLTHMSRCYREQLTDISLMVAHGGGRAAAEYVVTGTYLLTDFGLPPARGQTYTLPAGTFFEIRDGLIARVTTYYNLKRWIALVEGEQ